jgi:hypothetical protein
MLKPVRQEVHFVIVPEHWAQLGSQATHLPLITVKPFWQLATQFPLETIPEAQTQMLLRGVAPEGQTVWHLPWKK